VNTIKGSAGFELQYLPRNLHVCLSGCVFLQKHAVAELAKKSHKSHAFIRTYVLSVSKSIQSTPSHAICLTPILISSSHFPRELSSRHSFIRVTCPEHLIHVYMIIVIIFCEKLTLGTSSLCSFFFSCFILFPSLFSTRLSENKIKMTASNYNIIDFQLIPVICMRIVYVPR